MSLPTLPALLRMGYSSLTDLFIDRPTLNLFSAARCLSDKEQRVVPAQVGELLKAECQRRDDFHFFARVTLFTTFTGFDERGWTSRDWMRFGLWSGLLGEGKRDAAMQSWDCLKKRELPEGWEPKSIFDPVLEEALEGGFPGGGNEKRT